MERRWLSRSWSYLFHSFAEFQTCYLTEFMVPCPCFLSIINTLKKFWYVRAYSLLTLLDSFWTVSGQPPGQQLEPGQQNLQICGDVHLDDKDDKSKIPQHGSGGSSTTKFSRYFDEVMPIGSTSMDFRKLKLVHDPHVEVLNSLKHLDNQSGYKSANDRRLSTQSEHMGTGLNLKEPEKQKIVAAATYFEGTKCRETSEEKTISVGMSVKPFDICLKKTGTPKFKSSLFVQNREKRNEIKRFMGGQVVRILRPGMVLLKNFIPCRDQVKIVQTCRKLGQGNGGFYQPHFGDGRTVHSKMMCLGKNFDCRTKSYGERRVEDGAEPPPIPSEFHQLVQKAIQDAHACLLKDLKQRHVESVLPSMIPDICIVNFYTSNGRLGLHKDKSESQESLNRGLPVVSISIGDSAEFLYGDQRDIDKAEKVILESGDVLIFGGKSRHVYHGVASILPKTAPQALLQESDIRPGRLNLTFRKY